MTQLLNSSATCFFHTTITKLITSCNHETIEQVVLTNHETGDVLELDVDDVIISHGYERDASLLANSELPIQMVDEYYIATNAKGECSVPGLYAAGDISKYDGKLYLLTGAFQDAANAVNSAKRFIEPNADPYAMVSSHHEAFKERNRELVKQMLK